MINFEEELKNYQPLPELDDLEALDPNELQDVLRLVQSLAKKPRDLKGTER